MFKGWFFDMDGVLFDSMPNHAAAWEIVMQRHNLQFTVRDCYINEGRTGQDVISEALEKNGITDASEEQIWSIYKEKTDMFHSLGGALPMQGMAEVLHEISSGVNGNNADSIERGSIWVVTGSGQMSLLDHLNEVFPSRSSSDTYFDRQRMITAYDVVHGKPDPEPYLKAWERSGLRKDECVVVENAPLGVRAGKAAGLFVIAVNTGVLTRKDLWQAGADIVLDNMHQLLCFIQLSRYIESSVLPWYDTFDHGHDINHARSVIKESFNLCRQLETSDPVQPVDCLMAYTIAACHDLGLRIDREHHHLNSGMYIRQDKMLVRWFSTEQIEMMAQAAEDHRASRKEPPRSVYGCIVAEADRDIEPITILRRTVQFSLRHYPDFTKEQHLQRAYDHMLEKYSETGYLHLWMHSARNEKGLSDLRSIIHNKEKLMAFCSDLYDKETT